MDPNLTLVAVAAVGILPMTVASILTFVQTRRSELAQESRADRAAAEVAALAVRVQSRADLAAAEVAVVAVRVEEARQQNELRATAAASEVQHVATALETDRRAWGKNQDRTDAKLEEIHTLVDGRLTLALDTIEELKRMLQEMAPHNKRVQALVSKTA